MSRTYAQIECSLKSSKKLRSLSNHEARWAYLCAHLSDYCTFTGLFRYPLPMWAHDAQLTPEELDLALAELVSVGLIEHDPEEQFVRIVGWFQKRSGPDNPNRVDSVIADLSGLDCPDPDMICGSVSELAVASVRRSLRWKQDAPGRDQLYGSLKTFLAEVYQDYGDRFLEQFIAELAESPASVSAELNVIFQPLALTPTSVSSKGSERVTPTLREHETRRRRDLNETKTKKDLDETLSAQVSESASLQAVEQTDGSEELRKSKSPTLSAINSTIAQAARKRA